MGSKSFTGGLFASQLPERNFAREETLRKPVNLEHSVCVYPGSGPSSLVPSQEASLHSNYRSVRSALFLSRPDEDAVVEQVSFSGHCLLSLKALKNAADLINEPHSIHLQYIFVYYHMPFYSYAKLLL